MLIFVTKHAKCQTVPCIKDKSERLSLSPLDEAIQETFFVQQGLRNRSYDAINTFLLDK